MPAGTTTRGIWKNGVMPSRLISPTFGPWIFGRRHGVLRVHERRDAVLRHHALQRQTPDVAASQPIGLPRRKVILQRQPVLGSSPRRIVSEPRMRDPVGECLDRRVVACGQIAVDVERHVVASRRI